MPAERRGLAEEMWSQKKGEPLGGDAHYGRRLSGDAMAGTSLARDRHSAKRPSKQLRMPEATSSGEPDAGNLHVRFDEGRGTSVPSYSTGSVLAVISGTRAPESASAFSEELLTKRAVHVGYNRSLTVAAPSHQVRLRSGSAPTCLCDFCGVPAALSFAIVDKLGYYS
jgi:hypothetical protein